MRLRLAVLASLAAAAPAHAAEGWSAPQTVLPGATAGGAPAIAPDGTPLLAAGGQLHRASGTTFGSPSPFAGAAAQDVHVEHDGAGTRFLAWVEDGQAKLAIGGAAAQVLGPAASVDLAVAPGGAAVVAWRTRQGGGASTVTALRVGGAPQVVDPGSTSDTVRVAIDAAGDAVVAWRRRSDRFRTVVARAAAGAAFGEPAVVSGDGNVVALEAAYAAPGVPVVTWSALPTGAFAAVPGEGGWAVQQLVAGEVGPVAVSALPSGGLVASLDRGGDVAAIVAGADGRFGEPAGIAPAPGVVVAETASATGADGTTWLAATDPADGAIRLFAAKGGAFASRGVLGYGQGVALAAGAGGTAAAAWRAQGRDVVAAVHRAGQQGDPGAGPKPVVDGTAPKVTWIGPARVKAGRRLVVRLRVSEAAATIVAGDLRIRRPGGRKNRVEPFGQPERTLAPGAVRTVTVTLRPAVLQAVRAALRAKRPVKLSLRLSLKDAAGNTGSANRLLAVR